MKSSNRNWLTWKKIACVSLLLLAAGYIYGRPTIERWLNISLPEIPIGQENANNNDGKDQTSTASNRQFEFDGKNESQNKQSETNESNSVVSGFQLKNIGNGLQQSPAGLVYGSGPGGESRIDHILRHTKDIPDRPTHGVFDGGRDEVLALLDEVYKLIQKKSNKVNGRKSDQGGENRMEYTINLDRRIGYMGGQNGKRQNHPASSKLKLILEGNQPVTAYPNW